MIAHLPIMNFNSLVLNYIIGFPLKARCDLNHILLSLVKSLHLKIKTSPMILKASLDLFK